jgi:hypothetical protein
MPAVPQEARQVAENLWRWTAPHPDWPASVPPDSPSYWPRMVGSVLYTNNRSAVFIDPQLPPDPSAFWAWADERVGDRDVAVLTTIKWHRRSRDDFAARYGASTSRAKPNLPEGVESFRLRRAGETVFWLAEPRALVPGDRILGADGGSVRLCPESWLRYLGTGITIPELKARLRPLRELPIEHVLVSHGEPVIGNGAHALAKALV